ncbi:MAG: chemotaxis protein MotB [Gammaproteobacteria bacterium]|jgi:chemotaxis protein MotB
MTFADLMSLLMCFFVLLLSFSEMDSAKYKEVAGSMALAFGVQRDVEVMETPKGVSFVAREFAPGKPQPTVEKVLRQQTTDEDRQYLEILTAGGLEKLYKADAENKARKVEVAKLTKLLKEARQGHDGKSNGEGDAGKVRGSGKAEALGKTEAVQAARVQAAMLYIALEDEVDEGLVEVEVVKDGVLIRVREQGSFPSGTSDMAKQFLPVLDKIAGAMVSTDSKLVVSGHTDNQPIATRRYPSNWALSAARATSVVAALAKRGTVSEERMEVRAFADTDPIRSNGDAAGRASNRRVEIFIGTPPTPIDAEPSSTKPTQSTDKTANVRNIKRIS